MKNAIVLCSGGMDSSVTAWHVRKRLNYDKIIVLFFDYGQIALENERTASRRCADEISGEFIEMKLPELGRMSGSLINKEGEVKKMNREDLKDSSEESEKWYVPCRNLIFLNYALALAESRFKECEIFVGFKCEGKESYPDTTKEFVEDFNKLAKNCNGNFKIIAPLHDMDKEDIVLLGKELEVDLGKTWSCYLGGEKQCGECLACALRKEGFYWANVEDESEYSS